LVLVGPAARRATTGELAGFLGLVIAVLFCRQPVAVDQAGIMVRLSGHQDIVGVPVAVLSAIRAAAAGALAAMEVLAAAVAIMVILATLDAAAAAAAAAVAASVASAQDSVTAAAVLAALLASLAKAQAERAAPLLAAAAREVVQVRPAEPLLVAAAEALGVQSFLLAAAHITGLVHAMVVLGTLAASVLSGLVDHAAHLHSLQLTSVLNHGIY
jgi:hypothetical protein